MHGSEGDAEGTEGVLEGDGTLEGDGMLDDEGYARGDEAG